MQLSPARELAFDTFVQVIYQKKKPEMMLEEAYAGKYRHMKRLDRNLTKEILYGGFRWYQKIYWILQNSSKRDLDKTSPQVRVALVLGTYQIFYMDKIPDRAAVNESVQYIRKKGQASACPFVNGILRQIARRAAYFPKPDKHELPAEYLALQYAHPKWIVDRWFKRFSFERMQEMLSTNNTPPVNFVRVNSLRYSPETSGELQHELLRVERTHSDRRPLRSSLSLRTFPRLDEDSLFAQGHFTIQDEASQLIALLVDPQEKEKVLDVSCGPGGKFSHIYELGKEKITLLGIEKDAKQFERVQDNMKRLGFNKYEAEQTDFLTWKSRRRFDKVLADTPCSGLGVIRRHPEGKYQKSEEIVERMAAQQREFISKALGFVKKGGELIYSVCSFEQEESLDHLRWIEKTYGDQYSLVSPVARLPHYYKRYATRDNILMIYAGNKDGMDGFAAFILKRNY